MKAVNCPWAPTGEKCMRNMKRNLFCLFSAALLLLGATNYKVVARYPLPGAGGWDYLTFDEAARRIYISHATQVEVVDGDSGKVVGSIPDTPGVDGIAL